MLKFLVILVFALCCAGILVHFAPGVASHAFSLGSFAVSWVMVAFLVFLYAGHKMTSK